MTTSNHLDNDSVQCTESPAVRQIIARRVLGCSRVSLTVMAGFLPGTVRRIKAPHPTLQATTDGTLTASLWPLLAYVADIGTLIQPWGCVKTRVASEVVVIHQSQTI